MGIKLRDIFNAVSRAATAAWGVIQYALPIIRRLREEIPAIDQVADEFEALVARGGVEGADWVQRQTPVLAAIEASMADLVALAHEVRATSAELRERAADGTLDEQDATAIAYRLDAIRVMVARFGRSSEAAERLAASTRQ